MPSPQLPVRDLGRAVRIVQPEWIPGLEVVPQDRVVEASIEGRLAADVERLPDRADRALHRHRATCCDRSGQLVRAPPKVLRVAPPR